MSKEDFYVKYQDEISNYMVALGLFSQVPFYIIGEVAAQIYSNFTINDILQKFLVFVYFCRLFVRLLNMKFWLRSITHQSRMQICAVMLMLSYALLVICLATFDDLNNNGDDGDDDDSQDNNFTLIVLTLSSLWLSGVGAALSESTIVGYIKCFHPDQIEDFGTGQSIGSFIDLFMIFILNNFLISFKYAIYFGYLTVSMIPLLYCFNALENLRLE